MAETFDQNIKEITSYTEFYILGFVCIACCIVGFKLSRSANRREYDANWSNKDHTVMKVFENNHYNNVNGFKSKKLGEEIFAHPTVIDYYNNPEAAANGGSGMDLTDKRIKDEFLEEELA